MNEGLSINIKSHSPWKSKCSLLQVVKWGSAIPPVLSSLQPHFFPSEMKTPPLTVVHFLACGVSTSHLQPHSDSDTMGSPPEFPHTLSARSQSQPHASIDPSKEGSPPDILHRPCGSQQRHSNSSEVGSPMGTPTPPDLTHWLFEPPQQRHASKDPGLDRSRKGMPSQVTNPGSQAQLQKPPIPGGKSATPPTSSHCNPSGARQRFPSLT
mmetsp:Transcript_58514/g.143149  ORF Transcript_58514/g.143149 Transcript_58514/m.143149 type:complete len:210 (+) Transcript_58514:1681-2310(+)